MTLRKRIQKLKYLKFYLPDDSENHVVAPLNIQIVVCDQFKKKKRKKVRKKYFCLLGEYHPPPSPPTPGKEEGVPTRRGSDGKLRGRKRASDPAPPLDSDIEVNPWSHIVGNYQHFSPIFIFLSHTHSQTVMWLTLHICYFTAASVYLGSG